MRLIAVLSLCLGLLLAPPVQAQDSWKRQDLPEAGISLLMPGKPEAKVQSMGAANVTRRYMAYDDDGAVAVLATDMGSVLPNPEEAHARAGDGLRRQGMTVVSQTPVRYNGVPAVDLVVQLEGMTFTVRSIFNGQWLYLIFAMPAGPSDKSPAWTERVLNSVTFSVPR